MLHEIIHLALDMPGIYQLRKNRYRNNFFNGSGGRFFGVFNTTDEAIKCIGSERASSYADIDLTDNNIDSFSQIHLFDYPVIFNLLMMGDRAKSLIDFGGHIGVKYYAYKRLFPKISGYNWKVVDVPFCIERGRMEASKRGAANLTFYSNISEAGECDILLISGALQYITQSIAELLDAMASKPRFIILNKLPVHIGPDCCTIENHGKAHIPYRIFNKNDFEGQLLHKGFKNLDTWSILSRKISIPFFENSLDNFSMQGQIWENMKYM